MSQAACRGLTSVFFPSLSRNNGNKARKICAGCPVQFECHDYAMGMLKAETPITRGIWAGQTVAELRGRPERKPKKTNRTLPECANPDCHLIVPPNLNGRGKPRKFCSEKCLKHEAYLKYGSSRKRKIRPVPVDPCASPKCSNIVGPNKGDKGKQARYCSQKCRQHVANLKRRRAKGRVHANVS